MDSQQRRTALNSSSAWPEQRLEDWQDTHDTVHMWTQIVGKVRRTLTPTINHWWNVALYVSPKGLTTSPIPYGARVFEMEFDFIHHNLLFRDNDGQKKAVPLFPRSVADFYTEVMATLHSMGIEVEIHASPDEVPDPIPFAEDHTHKSYDPEAVHRFWRILISTSTVFGEFRARFIGKSSPVHFFWGGFDLAVSRFSGRPAPVKPDADPIQREAYSHEVNSVGFWPGGQGNDAIFYAYHVPEPPGFSKEVIELPSAYWDPNLKEFVLRYRDLRASQTPRDDLLSFAQSVYDAGAELANWDRAACERIPEGTRTTAPAVPTFEEKELQ